MSLDRYILRQCFGPFLVALAVATSVVWITQVLQRAELVIENGQSLATFLRLSLLIVPSLLSILIPFAAFGGALFALHRLHGDSEIAVLFAAGVGRTRIAAPFMLIATAAAAAVLWINLDAMPRSYRALKREIVEIRTDVANFVARDGEFTALPAGFTLYTDQTLPKGRFVGLLISDYRNPAERTTYMAQRALLQDSDAGPVLHLVNGNIQRAAGGGQIDIVEFERLSINLAELAVLDREARPLDATERYLGELLQPDIAQEWDRINARFLVAQGHDRLASPLYAYAFVLAALAAFLTGGHQRNRYAARLAGACIAVGLLKIGAVLLVDVAASSGAFWLLYLAPLVAIAVPGAALLSPPVKAKTA